MELTRNLKRYMRGDDVKAVKDRLLELGYLHASTHNMFGNDTYRAVKRFQSASGLEVDGIVGKFTWGALFGGSNASPAPVITEGVPDWLSEGAKKAIGLALSNVTDTRKGICLDALNWCVDARNPLKHPRCFYIRGGNLYNKDLSVNLMTNDRLKYYFQNANYKNYWNGGRKEFMAKAAADCNYSIPGADCSGFVVGLWRKYKIQSAGFDATANTLYHSHCVKTKAPKPGDLAWKPGHIGLVVGGGYVVESVGGWYGVQLTQMDARMVYSYDDKRLHRFSPWQAYGTPKKY